MITRCRRRHTRCAPRTLSGTTAQQIEALDHGLLETNARIDAITAFVQKATEALAPCPAPPDVFSRAERGGLRVIKGGVA